MTHPTIAMMADEQKRRELEHRANTHWKYNQARTRPEKSRLAALLSTVTVTILRTIA